MYYWKYKDESKVKRRTGIKKPTRTSPVINLNTKKVYESAEAAKDDVMPSSPNGSSIIRAVKKHTLCAGCYWAYYTGPSVNYNQLLVQYQQETKQRREQYSQRCIDRFIEKSPNRVRQVRCIETGVIYPSASEACRQFNISVGCVTGAIRGNHKSAGYHWRYID